MLGGISGSQKLMMGLQFVSQAIDKQAPIQNGLNDDFKKQIGVGKRTVKCNTCNKICCEACMGKTVDKCAKFGRGVLDLYMGSGKPCSVCKHGAQNHVYVDPSQQREVPRQNQEQQHQRQQPQQQPYQHQF